MKQSMPNYLIQKITALESYIQKQSSEKNNIQLFIEDLKTIAPNLSISALLNHLVAMYQEGLKVQEIIKDVHKTQKVFQIASEYIKNSEKDYHVVLLSKEIHDIILQNLQKALYLYQLEYDLSDKL